MATVEPVQGEALRYYVESSTEPGIRHVVDLAAYGGSGECSCPSFQFRCAPKLRLGERFVESVYCKHVKAARLHFTNMALKHASAALAGKRSLGGLSRSRSIQAQSKAASQQRSTSDTQAPF